jgi:hypothetical protein
MFRLSCSVQAPSTDVSLTLHLRPSVAGFLSIAGLSCSSSPYGSRYVLFCPVGVSLLSSSVLFCSQVSLRVVSEGLLSSSALKCFAILSSSVLFCPLLLSSSVLFCSSDAAPIRSVIANFPSMCSRCVLFCCPLLASSVLFFPLLSSSGLFCPLLSSSAVLFFPLLSSSAVLFWPLATGGAG